MPDAETAWTEILKELRLRLDKPQFQSLLAPSIGLRFEDKTLTVGVHNVYAQQWLENRLFGIVETEVTRQLGADASLVFTQLPQRGKPDTEPVEVVGSYLEARNDLVQPHKHVLVTDYFRRRWLPLLGPSLGWTIIALRRRAYRNYKTGETRDGLRCTLSDLAREAGVKHWRTISRNLQKPCAECKRLHKRTHPVADHFVLEHSPVYQTSKRFSRHVRVGTRFRILLDDPLTPADEIKLRTSK